VSAHRAICDVRATLLDAVDALGLIPKEQALKALLQVIAVLNACRDQVLDSIETLNHETHLAGMPRIAPTPDYELAVCRQWDECLQCKVRLDVGVLAFRQTAPAKRYRCASCHDSTSP
jgi:hypothetical protein